MTTVGWSFDLKIKQKKKRQPLVWFGLFENLEVQELLGFIVFRV